LFVCPGAFEAPYTIKLKPINEHNASPVRVP